MTSSRLDRLIAYGDSQTAGFSWGPKMVALSDTLTEAIGRGVSGQEAGSVAIRQGGIVLTTTAECTIPATGEPVDIPVSSSVVPCNIRYGASDMPVILAGVRGVLTVIATSNSNATTLWDRASGSGTLRFTPSASPDEAVTVPSGSAFVSQDVEDHPDWAESLQVIWVGGNDAAFAWKTRVTGVVSAVTAMADRLRGAVDEPRFLVASRTTGPTNTEGTSSWQTAVDQRDALKAAFPDNAIDIWGHVRDNGLDILGIKPTQADLDALAGKTVPPSLTSDGIHYSTDTREKVLAPFIISELSARGWTTESEEEEPTVAFTPKNDWKAGDYYKADRIIELEATVAANASAAATATEANETASSAAQGVADLREAVEAKADTSALTAGLDKKVDVKGVENKNTVYGISNGGSLAMYKTGVSTSEPATMAMRGRGGVLKVGEPTAVDHATTKKYVDDLIAAQAALITALTDRVATLEAK